MGDEKEEERKGKRRKGEERKETQKCHNPGIIFGKKT